MVKVISLSEEAYQTIKGIKESEESFSDVVLRLASKKGNILSLFGCAKEDPEFIRGLRQAYKERDTEILRVY